MEQLAVVFAQEAVAEVLVSVPQLQAHGAVIMLTVSVVHEHLVITAELYVTIVRAVGNHLLTVEILTAVDLLVVLASLDATLCVHVSSITTYLLRADYLPAVTKVEQFLELKTTTDSVTGQDKVDTSILTLCQVCQNRQEEVFRSATAGDQTELAVAMNIMVECHTTLLVLVDKLLHHVRAFVTKVLEADGEQLELDLFNRNKYS